MSSLSPCNRIRIPEAEKFLLVETPIWALESGIPLTIQRAKKVLSDSPGLVDFAIGLVISVLKLPDGQKRVWGLVKMTCGLVNASYSLPEWQAVKLTFFAPCD